MKIPRFYETELLSIHRLLCRKFSAVRRKAATFCLVTYLTNDTDGKKLIIDRLQFKKFIKIIRLRTPNLRWQVKLNFFW